LELAHETGIHIWTPQLLGNGLASAIAAGDAGAAQRLSADYAALPLDGHPVDLIYQQCIFAWRAFAAGDHTAALRHQSAALELVPQVGMPFLETLSHLGMAHVLQARGDSERARDHLSHAQLRATQARLDLLQFPCRLTAAHLAFALGDDASGTEHLRAALRIGSERGLRNCYWWERGWLAELATRAVHANIELPYVLDLVRSRDLVPQAPPLDFAGWPWHVKVYMLGRFEVVIDGQPLRFERKAQRRPLEVLQALIALGGREVPEEDLLDALYGKADKASHFAFGMALKNLRGLLGNSDLVRLSHSKLSLDARRCWVDAWACERWCGRTESALRAGDGAAAQRALDSVLETYRGHLLGNDAPSWAIPLRERLRDRVCRCVESVGAALQAAQQHEAATACYRRALDIEPFAETLYRELMRCYGRLGHKAEAAATYRRCQRVLTAAQLALSANTEALYRELCGT
jgi:DNA-binding SARP family transcriptional activator